MRIEDLKVGDIIFCKRNYIDTEITISLRKYAKNNKFIVHLQKNKPYKVCEIQYGIAGSIIVNVKNDFGEYWWYDFSIFDNIKELRKQKLRNIKNGIKSR